MKNFKMMDTQELSVLEIDELNGGCFASRSSLDRGGREIESISPFDKEKEYVSGKIIFRSSLSSDRTRYKSWCGS